MKTGEKKGARLLQESAIDYKPARLTNCGCKKDTLEVVAPIAFLLLQLLLPIMQHVATVPANECV
jgi:hypothetical protein